MSRKDDKDGKDAKLHPPLALPTPESKSSAADDSATVQKMVEHLSPEERAAFMRNLKRWAQLSADERQNLRRQSDERQNRMQTETDNALRETGLTLDNDRREVFMLRYGQERRKLERELQEKLAAERIRRTPELLQRLKKEFEAAPPTPSPTAGTVLAGPTVTASPSLTPTATP